MKVRMPSLVFVSIVLLAACGSTPSPEQSAETGQMSIEEALALIAPTPEQAARIKRYAQLGDGFATDQALIISDDQEPYPIDPYYAAYEAYQIVRLFDLFEDLTLVERHDFATALFADLPPHTNELREVRAFAIANWFDDGSPLVMTTWTGLLSGANDIPALAVLFNVPNGVRESDISEVRAAGPSVEYPRIIIGPDGPIVIGGDRWVYRLYPNGHATGASVDTDRLPTFEDMTSALERANLADAYLRDGDPSNDAAVVEPLRTIINEEPSPLVAAFAHLQLSFYFLTQGDLVSARGMLDTLNTSGLLEDPTVADTEIAKVARVDMPEILLVAQALASGDRSVLER